MRIKDFFKRRAKSKKGFTIVEMIATVCIIAIVSAATVEVIFAVQSTVRSSGDITVNQYKTTQVERFMRNEFQVATAVTLAGAIPSSGDENDEIMFYNATGKCVEFWKVPEGGTVYEQYLVIDSVDSVTLSIYPMSSDSNAPYKMVYNIDAGDFKYDGGIVLSNTSVSDTNDDTKCFDGYPDTEIKNLNWGFDAAGNALFGNGTYIKFHSEVPYEVSSTTSP